MLLHIEESAEMVGLISQRAVSPFPVSSFEESRLRFPVHNDIGTSGFPVSDDLMSQTATMHSFFLASFIVKLE